MLESVLDCVIPYIQDGDDLNSVSLVSKKFFDIVSLTRKHLTVHVHFAPDPKRVTHRFPNLESLALKSYSYGRNTHKCSIPVTPWILEIVKLEHLNSLSIRNMVVSDSDLQLLAKTRGASLRSLEIWGCKLCSEDGLVDIVRCCIHLTSLSVQYIDLGTEITKDGYSPKNGKWVHELALCNSVMESLDFYSVFDGYDTEDITLLAKKCSNSLVSLDIHPRDLNDFTEVFKHAKKLDHFGYGAIFDDVDYSGFRFPPNIRGLRIDYLTEHLFHLLTPYLNQLRELELNGTGSICQCYFFKWCPNIEVMCTRDKCGDKGLEFIGQFCKKLRKLTHYGRVTQKGLIAVAQGCPKLEHLNVYILDISNKSLECVGTSLKNLRDFRLSLDDICDITDFPLDNGVRAMLRGCKKLERIDMDLCPDALTDVGLGYVGAYGHNLRHLCLINTGESDVGLQELLKGCPKLRKLKLNGCPFSKQAIATYVFSINQSLRYVWLDFGYRADDVSVLTRPMVSAQVEE